MGLKISLETVLKKVILVIGAMDVTAWVYAFFFCYITGLIFNWMPYSVKDGVPDYLAGKFGQGQLWLFICFFFS